MNYEQAVRELQDNLIGIAEIERRQSAMLRQHAEILHQPKQHTGETLEFRRRTEQNLGEITDKLNGLIGFDGLLPSRPS